MKFVKNTICILLTFSFLFTVSGCRKRQDFSNESAQDAVDIRVAMGEIDELIKNINIIISEQFTLRGRPGGGGSGSTSVCGVQLDTAALARGNLDLRFTGEVCGKRSYKGNVSVKFDNYPLTKWKNKSAIASISLNGFRILNAADGKTWQLEGQLNLINQTGGTFYDLMYLNMPSLIFDLKAEKLKYSIGANEYGFLYLHRRMTYTHAKSVITCEVQGLAEANGKQKAECWGENRKAEEFVCSIPNSYKWNTSCGAQAPTEGSTEIGFIEKTHVLKSEFSRTASGDRNEQGCAFGFQVSWSLRNKTNTRIFSYF